MPANAKQTRTDVTLDVVRRKNKSYLPSQLVFSTQAKEQEFQHAMGFKNDDEMNKYLNNHFKFTAAYDDVTGFFNGNHEVNMRVVDSGIYSFDPETNRIKDRWGMEFDIDAPYGFFNYGHILEGASEEEIRAYKAPELRDDMMDMLFSMAMEDKAKYEKDYVVMCSGYCGIFERAYNMLSMEDFMYYMAVEPDMLYEFMGKVTDMKVRTAEEAVKRGFRMGHHGDDLGTQVSTLFSVDMFKKLVLPHIARVFKVYKDAGIPVQLHSCGNIVPFIPYLIDAGLDVLEPTQPVMDINYLKREFGKDLTFYGGVDTQQLLAFGTPQQVRDETRRTIDVLGKDGGLIIAPAQEIMPNVPIENVVAFAETVKECQGDQAKQFED